MSSQDLDQSVPSLRAYNVPMERSAAVENATTGVKPLQISILIQTSIALDGVPTEENNF